MNIDRRLLKYLLKLKFPFGFSLLLSLVGSAAIIIQAKLLSNTINNVFLNDQLLNHVLPILLLYLLFAFLRAASHWGADSAAIHITARVKSDVRGALTRQLVLLGPSYMQTQQTGELKNVVDSGVEALDAYFREYLPQLVLAALIPILILIFVFPIDLLSGFVFLFTAPLIPLFMILIGDIAQTLTKKQWLVLSRMNAFFLDVLQGLTMLKILGRSQDYSKKIQQITNEFQHTTISVLRVAFLSALVLEMLATISTAIIAVEIGLRLLYSKMAFEQALFVLILAPEFYQPLRQLGARFHAGMEGFAAAKRIFEILEQKQQVIHGTTAAPLDIQSLEFENVSYSYPNSENTALVDLNISLKAGQRVAIVGASGAGKSTLVSLLLRFIEPTTGLLRANGQPLVDLNSELWLKRVSWLPQHPFIFHDSVLENLRLAKEDASDVDIERALKSAHAYDFIQELPDGLNTIIGERGARLSGGQAQRLALARAFLKEAPIFILDEPTSQLDAKTELLVQHAIDELSADRLVIAIAHRLYTVKNADIIFVLDEGKVVCSGRHEDLEQRNLVYQRLIQAQEIVA
jgi:ATP-binding cassette, subfamily C, bacterial CydD